jgi:hypothetical protein
VKYYIHIGGYNKVPKVPWSEHSEVQLDWLLKEKPLEKQPLTKYRSVVKP